MFLNAEKCTHNLIYHLVDHGSEVVNDLDVLGIQVGRPREAVSEGFVIEVHAADILVLLFGHYGRVDRGGEGRERRRPAAERRRGEGGAGANGQRDDQRQECGSLCR